MAALPVFFASPELAAPETVYPVSGENSNALSAPCRALFEEILWYIKEEVNVKFI